MSATVKIYRWTGAGPSSTDITGINTRVDLQDAHSTADTANPVRIPASGTNYSYVCWTRLHCTVAPATAINNIKWYSDGTNSFGTGVGCNVATGSTYTQATSGGTGTGTELNALTGYSVASAFSYTSGSPLSVSGSLGATTGDFGNYVAYQITVGSTASAGPTAAQETFTWSWDES